MKKLLILTISLFFASFGYSQTISAININGSGNLDIISFGLGSNIQVYITNEGQISKWGYDRYVGYTENYNGILDPYVGRIEYYSEYDDASVRGKVKYIGQTLLTYYPSYENENLQGKLKSIGTFNIEYYREYDDAAFKGLISKVGQNRVTWFASYENEALRGKLKSFGPTNLTYYTSFDDKAFRGKIKSVDRFTMTYYSSFELYSGSIKSGAQVFNANGVKYFLKNY